MGVIIHMIIITNKAGKFNHYLQSKLILSKNCTEMTKASEGLFAKEARQCTFPTGLFKFEVCLYRCLDPGDQALMI